MTNTISLTFQPAAGSPWKTAQAARDGRTVTLLRSVDRNPQGKHFSLVDGELVKEAAEHHGRYDACSVYVPDLAALAEMISGFGHDEVLVLGHIPDAGAEPYRVIPAARLARQLGLSKGERPVGIHTIGGIRYAARIKENFAPSRYAYIDRDTNAPAGVNALSIDEYVNLLDRAWPGFGDAERVIFPSSSGRVAYADGRPATATGVAAHIYFELADDAWQDWDDLRMRLEVSSAAQGVTFAGRSKAGAALRRCPWDTSVFSTCREVFESAPVVGPGLICLPREWTHVPGKQCPLPPGRTPSGDGVFERVTGSRIHGNRATTVDTTGVFTFNTQIETDRYGVITVAEFVERKLPKTRCQTFARESSSWNGFLNWTKNGDPFFYDNGIHVTYFLSDADSADVSRETNDEAPIDSEWKDFPAAIGALKKSNPAQCRALARKILSKYAPQSPRKRSFADLLSAVIAALPDGANPGLPRSLTTFANWLERQARIRAVASSSIDPAALKQAGIEYRPVTDLAGVAAMIAANSDPLYLIKAPIAAGKTQLVLKPLAQLPGCVVGVTNRVSLVSDLCHSANLDLDNYQQVKPRDVEITERLGICLPSIINPKFSDVLNRADSLLIDEISGALREIHTIGGVMGKSGPDVMRRIAGMVNNARIAAGADADLSTLDVLSLKAAIQRPIVVIEMTAQRPGLTVLHDDADKVKANILTAVANGEKCRVACDSSRAAIELAALLRERNPEKKIVCIQSRPGDSTAGDPDVLKLLSDVNAGIVGIDCLIHSPTVESGVSITVKHFTRTFGLFGGRTVSPMQFLQMLQRDRTATVFEIGFAGHCRQWLNTEPLAILDDLEATHRRTVEIVADARDTVAGLVRIEPATEFDRTVCHYKAARHIDLNDAAQNLLLLAESRGFAVRRDLGFVGISKEEKLEARQLADADYQDRVLSATAITDEQREALENKYQLSPIETAEAERFDAAMANGVAADDLTADDLRLYEHGALTGWVKRWELLNAAPLAGLANDVTDGDFTPQLALRRNEVALTEAYRTLWEVAGLDWLDGTGEVTAESALETWRNLSESEVRPVLEHAGLCRFGREPAYPVRWLGDALRKFGIGLDEHKGDGDVRVYTLATEVQTSKDGLTVKAPGLSAMNTIRQMRQERIKDYRPACAGNWDVQIDVAAMVRNARAKQGATA